MLPSEPGPVEIPFPVETLQITLPSKGFNLYSSPPSALANKSPPRRIGLNE